MHPLMDDACSEGGMIENSWETKKERKPKKEQLFSFHA